MSDERISFIGGGNMARSLVQGLTNDGMNASRLVVADPDAGQLQAMARATGVGTTHDNVEAVRRADVVVLAVKPQIMRTVVQSLAPALQQCGALIVSIAAGIRSDDLARWVGGDPAIVRAMPNTPALLGAGATALFANAATEPARRDIAETLLRSVGVVVWLDDEALMDAVTAISGSGPAYFFLLMEAMERAAAEFGLNAEQARLLVAETAVGAARMALEGRDDVATLRRRVTSPGGTTAAALGVMEDGDFAGLVKKALNRARLRSIEMAGEFGRDGGPD